MTTTKRKKEQAKEEIAKLIGDTPEENMLYLNITHVARSGMSRRIEVYAQAKDGGKRLLYITSHISELLDMSRNDKGLLVSGCGMDMAYWLVTKITRDLYGEGVPVLDYQVL